MVKVRVQIQDQVLEFGQAFEYQSGKYTFWGSFQRGSESMATSFLTINPVFFVGLGTRRLDAGYYQGFQRLDPQSGTWTPVSFPAESRLEPLLLPITWEEE
ncbi:hypothetical protein [Algoriphagus boritolerans]|uniref:hypothetical protein n=1 Tax=Algoriphagus boritolerans TaxID=308111 RepID=UPI000A69135D